MRSLIIIVVLAIAGGRASAYPQFQLSRDQTCSGCHISPTGGGLLNENGMNFAEAESAFGTNPELLNGVAKTPAWLQFGGDFRAMSGYVQAPQRYLVTFPMQADLYGQATYENFALHATIGLRPRQEGNEALTVVWPRELYFQWNQTPGSPFGAFARVGQLMPVFGLRYVEHPVYTRRYGGTPMFSEAWGVTGSYIQPRYELHVSGYMEPQLFDPVRQASGGAVYGELRIDDKTQVGAGGLAEVSSFDHEFRGTLTAKRFFPGAEVLLQGEAQLVNQHVDDFGYLQLVSYLSATYFAPKGLMFDIGWGHYDENIRIGGLDRDALELNAHWFTTSHLELIWVNRAEFIAWGDGGPTGALSMLQVHYRL